MKTATRRVGLGLVASVLVFAGSAAPSGAETHRLKPRVGYPTFAVRPPVLTVKPGDLVETESLWGGGYETEGGQSPGEVGPIAVAGASPGDTLVVEILKVRPNRDTAVSTQDGRDPFPRGRYVWRLDRERMTGTVDLLGSTTQRVTIPLRPMLGRVAVAPEGNEAFGGLGPGPFGGNMDTSGVREGTTVFLPVFHEGGLFYFGGGHAAMGDGEACGSGLETSMDVTLRFGLVKGRKIDWPRLEDAEYLMVAGSARSLTDAFRIAFTEMANWLQAEHGFARADALQILSQVAVVRVANVVDPLHTVVAKFPKSYLPVKAGAEGTPGRRLPDMPWTEAEGFLSPDRIVVLPLGAASKEHGPHLLLRNDEILAEYYARRVVEARPVAMLPTLTYGFYPAFLEYPGSVSLAFDTQRDVVAEICRSIARFGPRRFYVLNTGVSTLRPLKATAELLAAEGIVMRFTDVLKIGHEAEAAVKEQKFGTHADEIETSMVLYMQPSAVRMERAAAGGDASTKGPLTRDAGNRDGVYSASGVFGDARLATWQKGQRVVEAAVKDILAEIDALAREPIKEGAPGSPLEKPAQ